MIARITEVVVTPLAFVDPPLLNADGVHEPFVLRALIELHAETSDGRTVTGYGESTGHAWQLDYLERVGRELVDVSLFHRGRVRQIVDDSLRASSDSGDASWRRWADRGGSIDTRGPAPLPAAPFDVERVFSALEVALLDAQGRALGVPVVDLLGGAVRDRVAFSAYLFYKWAEHPATADEAARTDEWGGALDADGIVDQARMMVERHGFRSLKLKGGVFEPDLEVDTIRALRKAFPDAPLRLDPNAAWSVSTAIAAAHRLEGLLEYLEDPAPGLAGMATVARSTSIPLATNMVVTSLAHVREAMSSHSIAILLGDHHYWGGLRGSVELSAVTRSAGWGMSMHSNSHLGVSLAAMTAVAATVPELGYACDTHLPWNLADDILRDPLVFEQGAVHVGRKPGLGVEIDRTTVARLHAQYLALHREHRNDGAYRRSIEPTFETGLPRW